VSKTDDVIGRIRTLSPAERTLLFREMFNDGGLSDKERVWVSDYLTDMDPARASKRTGISGGWKSMLSRPQVAAAVEMHMAVRDAVSVLKAEYIKQYLLDVLELCPLDFVEVTHDGDFVCDINTFRAAPREIQRLVERFEIVWYHGRRRLRIEFVSKSSALAMAAKYTLVQKFQGAVAALPWDQVAGMLAQGKPVDIIEQELDKRLKELPDVGDAERPVPAGSGSVA